MLWQEVLLWPEEDSEAQLLLPLPSPWRPAQRAHQMEGEVVWHQREVLEASHLCSVSDTGPVC
jgi:hypothetical protein